MSDPSVVENGALMLRLQLAGMVFMGVVLISTCTFQSAGQAVGAFLLSVSRQGVIFAIVLNVALRVAGSADRGACSGAGCAVVEVRRVLNLL